MNMTNSTDDCQPLSFNISSNGLWENSKSPNVTFGYSLPLMEIQLLVIFVSIVMSHMFLRCIGISQTTSSMIAGLILAPPLFDLRGKSSSILSQDTALDGNAALNGFSMCGAILFTFLVNIKTNRRVVFNSGKLPVLIGILTFVLPLFVGICFRIFLTGDINPHYMPPKKALAERTMIIGSQSYIVMPTITYILLELKILNSEFGRLTLSASIINDLNGVGFLVVVYVVKTYIHMSRSIAYTEIIGVVVLILFVIFVVKPAMEWIVEHTPQGKSVADVYIHAVILLVLASGVYTTMLSMKHLLGPLFISIVVPEGPPLGSSLEAKYDKITMNVLLPISITFSTMRCDVTRIIYQLDDILYNIFLIALTYVLKLVASFAPCVYFGLSLKDSISVAILLSCKSFTDIFLLELPLDESYISQATYSLLVVFSLLNSAIVPIVLKSLYDPNRKYASYQNRNIFSLKPKSELRILTCVHKPDNISGVISFLKLLSSPNRELPVMVTVLNLVKLVGQIMPVVIPHSKKSRRLSNNSYINTVLNNFSQFKRERLDSTTVTMFTAFSHVNIMHEDICTLALDQTASMIVVPSGRTWTIDGAFHSDDDEIRRLNMSLLERAPCSVGILVDRGQFTLRENKRQNIDVGVIFIGGKNDREALSLAKRMKHNPKVRVTVIRLISNQVKECTTREYHLDEAFTKELEESMTTIDIAYTERIVNGGPQLAFTVRLLAEEYDLIVVGSDHGAASPDFTGLKEWVELPELGVIGDLLAVKDLRSRLSVLVVQHQHHM